MQNIIVTHYVYIIIKTKQSMSVSNTDVILTMQTPDQNISLAAICLIFKHSTILILQSPIGKKCSFICNLFENCVIFTDFYVF